MAMAVATTTGALKSASRKARTVRAVEPARRCCLWYFPAVPLEGHLMADTEGPWVQLATRIPKSLHRTLKLHCVTLDTTLMDFVVAALTEKLVRGQKHRKRA
jgi:hypothetical protein